MTTEVWYCWRVRVIAGDETTARLLVPRSDPHVYETPADLLFTTADEARAWWDEEADEEADDEAETAYLNSWLLCRQTLEVVQ